MLLKYFKFLLLGLFLLASACFQVPHCKSNFNIDKLPEAILNQPYKQEIGISGRLRNDSDITWKVAPENSGLTITRFIDKESGLYGGIEISGIPKYVGEITIHLYVGNPGGYVCMFDKAFILKVNPK